MMKNKLKNKYKRNFLFFLALFIAFPFFSEDESLPPVKITYSGGRNYTLVERTDLRRYDNGKYTGLVSREVRSFISRISSPRGFSKGFNAPNKRSDSADGLADGFGFTDSFFENSTFYEGSFFVQEDTKRASQNVKNGIHESIPSSFRITDSGELIMSEDNGYPSFRSFPSFSAHNVKIGDKWQAKAERAVDPLNKGIITKIPMFVEYTFLGETLSRGEEVYVLKAQWATRYGISYFDFSGDSELKSANGKHIATMHISKSSGYAIVVRDSVDETFVYSDGNQVSFKGTISLFTEYPPKVDREKLIPAIQRVAKISDDEAEKLKKNLVPDSKIVSAPKTSAKAENPENPKKNGFNESGKNKTPEKYTTEKDKTENDIKVENTEAGIRLTIQNLQFKADSSELLSGEEKRLDSIASILKQVPSSQFLVEGHTAKTGNEKGEQILSEQRAKKIAEELSRRGIEEGRFIVKGSGSRKPVAENSSPEGKAMNRRVEITILE